MCSKVCSELFLLPAEQSQLFQPFLIGEVLHSSNPLQNLPLDWLKQVHVLFKLRTQELDTVFQVRSHQSRRYYLRYFFFSKTYTHDTQTPSLEEVPQIWSCIVPGQLQISLYEFLFSFTTGPCLPSSAGIVLQGPRVEYFSMKTGKRSIILQQVYCFLLWQQGGSVSHSMHSYPFQPT